MYQKIWSGPRKGKHFAFKPLIKRISSGGLTDHCSLHIKRLLFTQFVITCAIDADPIVFWLISMHRSYRQRVHAFLPRSMFHFSSDSSGTIFGEVLKWVLK